MMPSGFFSGPGPINTMSPTHTGRAAQQTDPKAGSTMASEQVATVTRPADVGLRRERGLIGATWASVTSIIGCRWLFGSWKGAYSAGTSALLAWVIGVVIVIILALV